jgi:hypothetical protein
LLTVSNQIVALKSIAAYRSGLEINPNVSKTDAEDGLRKELTGRNFFYRTPKTISIKFAIKIPLFFRS